MKPNFQEYLEQTGSIAEKSNIKANNHLLDKIIVRVEEIEEDFVYETLNVMESINDILLEAIDKLKKLKK